MLNITKKQELILYLIFGVGGVIMALLGAVFKISLMYLFGVVSSSISIVILILILKPTPNKSNKNTQ